MSDLLMQLDDVRKEKGITKQKIADLLGVSYNAVMKWYSRINEISYEHLQTYACVVGCDLKAFEGSFQQDRDDAIEQICDHYCKYPDELNKGILNKDEFETKCDNCPLLKLYKY